MCKAVPLSWVPSEAREETILGYASYVTRTWPPREGEHGGGSTCRPYMCMGCFWRIRLLFNVTLILHFSFLINILKTFPLIKCSNSLNSCKSMALYCQDFIILEENNLLCCLQQAIQY